jgi:AcrR family transcriptional regulator
MGLREQKKRQTRQQIADAAATLFATHGFENVTVQDVARAAEVSEQTVYNYFPSKEHLVFDRAEEMEAALLDDVRSRPPGTSVLAVIRARATRLLDGMASVPPHITGEGGMPHLVATSPGLRRWAHDLFAQNADVLAQALAAEHGHPEDVIRSRAVAQALLAPLHVAILEVGRQTAAGATMAQAVAAVRPSVEAAFDQLEQGLGAYATGARPGVNRTRRRGR